MTYLKRIKFRGYLISGLEKNIHLTDILFRGFIKNNKRKSRGISTFLLLINVIVIKCATETLISLL